MSEAEDEKQAENDLRARLSAQYDDFASRVQAQWQTGQARTLEGFESAMHSVREQLEVTGQIGLEQSKSFADYLRRDLQHTIEDMDRAGAAVRDTLGPARLGAGALAFIAKALSATSEAIGALANKAEAAVTFKTGEITTAGTLTCLACGQELHMKQASYIPPCPSCHKTLFRKSY